MLLLCRITIIILHNAIRFIHIDLNPTPSIVNSVEGIVVYNNLHDMAVRLKYADLTYVKQPDARPLDLTSFREAGAAITAAADNLQERAIRNENAYNEMAIKMSEYNAIQGADEEALAGKINETQEHIKAKVDEDGGWFFADTAVSDGARRFLTDEGVKTILGNKTQFDAMMQANEQSDASEEYKALNRAMILKRFNDAGGSLGGNGKQSISAFGTALGSGHDREALHKEMLEYFKAMKSDEKVIYSEQFRKQAIDLMNNPTIDAITKSTLKTLSNPTLHGFQSFTKTIEGIGDDRLINVAKAIVSNNSKFKNALLKEAELNLFALEQKGITPSNAVKDNIYSTAFTDSNILKTLVINSPEYKNANSNEKIVLLNAINNPNSIYIKELIDRNYSFLNQNPNETESDYEARLSNFYKANYIDSEISNVATYLLPMRYTKEKLDVDNKFFESLFNKQLEKSEDTSKILTRERDGLVGTIVNLPSMTSELEANRKARLLNQTSQHSKNISELERFNNYLAKKSTNGENITKEDEDKLKALNLRVQESQSIINNILSEYDAYKGGIPTNKEDKANLSLALQKSIKEYYDVFNRVGIFGSLTNVINEETSDLDENGNPIKGTGVDLRDDVKFNANDKTQKHIDEYLHIKDISYILSNSDTPEEGIKKATKFIKNSSKTNPYVKEFADNISKTFGDISTGLTSILMGNLIENYGNETNMIQSNPGVVIGISKPTETGIVSTVRNNIAYKIENHPEAFTIIDNQLLDDDDLELDAESIGVPIDLNNESLRKFLYTEDKGTDKNPKYSKSDITYELMELSDGRKALNLIKNVQGFNNVRQKLTIVANNDADQNTIDEFELAMRMTSAFDMADRPNADTKFIFDAMSTHHGGSLTFGPDPSNAIQMNDASAYNIVEYNGRYYNNVKSLLNAFVKNPITNVDKTIYHNNFRITFSKDSNNNFITQIDTYDSTTNSFELTDKFISDNSEDFINNTQRRLSVISSILDYKDAYRLTKEQLDNLTKFNVNMSTANFNY